MHIVRHRRSRARHFHAQILTLTAAALIALPALAAGPGGPLGPVVAPPKAPSTPSAPTAASTAPVIPQAPVVMPNIPSVTAGRGAPTGRAKAASPADDRNSAMQDSAETRSDTASTNGGGTTGTPQGIADQANAGNLSSYLRIPDAKAQPHDQDNPIPGIDVVVRKHPSGAAMHVTTDRKGNASIGELKRGESYDIVIGGSKPAAGA